MKKMILGLALCLGLSQVVVASENKAVLSDKDVKGAVAWIKAHPAKVALITAGVAAVLGFTAYAGVKAVKSEKAGVWAKTKDGASNAAYNVFVNPLVFGKDKAVAATGWTKDKAVAGGKLARTYWKTSASVAVIAVIAATILADYATTDKEAELRMTKLWKKLLGKKPVVA